MKYMVKKRHGKQEWIVLLLCGLIVLLLAVVLGYYIGSTQLSQKPASKDMATGWQTYTNELPSYQFKYPIDFSATKDGQGVAIVPKINNENTITPRLLVEVSQSKFKSVTEFIDLQIGQCEPGMGCKKYEPVTIGGKDYMVYDGPSFVVTSHCFVRIERSLLIQFCDQGLRNDALMKSVILSFSTFN